MARVAPPVAGPTVSAWRHERLYTVANCPAALFVSFLTGICCETQILTNTKLQTSKCAGACRHQRPYILTRFSVVLFCEHFAAHF